MQASSDRVYSQHMNIVKLDSLNLLTPSEESPAYSKFHYAKFSLTSDIPDKKLGYVFPVASNHRTLHGSRTPQPECTEMLWPCQGCWQR